MTAEAERFVHEERALRVVFGESAFDVLGAEVDRLSGSRVLVVASARLRDRATRALGARVVAVAEDPVMHVPVDQVERTLALARSFSAQVAVAVGGGSAIGLAKAIARRTGVDVVAVPTTYAGSEMTRVWGETADGVKTTGRAEQVAPRTVLYDPELVASMPPSVAVPSAFNALAHAVEALWAPDRTPLTDLMATEAVRRIVDGVRPQGGRAPEHPGPGAMRATDLLRGAWLSGMCLDRTTMGLHHRLCHALGGAGLPHAPTHMTVLPHVMAYNLAVEPEARAVLAGILGGSDPGAAVHRIQTEIGEEHGAETGLRRWGMTDADVADVVRRVLAAPYSNPRTPSADDLRVILQGAMEGAAPAVW